MDYLYFVASVLAIGLIVGLVLRSGFMKDRLFETRELSRVGRETAPPLKKTVGGMSERELEQMEFQNRIDVWQKSHLVSRETFEPKVPVNGQKYEFIPTPRNMAQSRSRPIRTGTVRQQFQLLN